jgi:PHP family Zn ribbon phosphoesterase
MGITGGIAGDPRIRRGGGRTRRFGGYMATPAAYCVKCKTKREMKDAVQITMKNGRPATEGKCPECGTKMFKIGAA